MPRRATAAAPTQEQPQARVRHVPGEPWTKATMLDLLDRSPLAVERALLVLYSRQTADERNAEATVEHNGQGFGAFDAAFLTSCAKQVEENRYDRPEGQRLSHRRREQGKATQFELVQRKVKKYVNQLVEVANARLERGEAPTPVTRREARAAEIGSREERAHAREVYGISVACDVCEDRRFVAVRNQVGDADVAPCPRCNAEQR